MKQGEIWLANLEPSQDNEQASTRPVTIISGDLLNSNLNIIIICPLTSKVKRFFGGLILEPNKKNGLQLTSEVLVFHIRAISKRRLIRRIGKLESEEVKVIKANVDDLLTL